MLWDLNEGKHLYTLSTTETINALAFSPNRYWLCAATGANVKIWVSVKNTEFVYLFQWSFIIDELHVCLKTLMCVCPIVTVTLS